MKHTAGVTDWAVLLSFGTVGILVFNVALLLKAARRLGAEQFSVWIGRVEGERVNRCFVCSYYVLNALALN